GRDVAEQRHRAGAGACPDLLPVGGDGTEVGLHDAEVALVDPGEHLTDERGSGGSRNGQAGHRIPDDVDPDRGGAAAPPLAHAAMAHSTPFTAGANVSADSLTPPAGRCFTLAN